MIAFGVTALFVFIIYPILVPVCYKQNQEEKEEFHGYFLNWYRAQSRKSISYPTWSIFRRILVALTITLSHNQVLTLFSLNFLTLGSLILVGLTQPHKNKIDYNLELVNEFLLLTVNYHMMCLTNFVVDPGAR